MAPPLIWLLLHFVVAAAATWLARRYALRADLLDHPGERRSHNVATPRGGGISIVFAMLVGIGWLATQSPQQAMLLGCFGVGLLLVAGIGWLDDHRPLSPWLRLAVQSVAALVLACGVQGASGGWLLPLLAFGLVMALVNVWNFMDGIDGLAASQAGIVAAGLALMLGQGPWAWLAAGLAAAVAGFLPFNFPVARIFLGDVGSGALGYLLAGLLVAGLASAPRQAWPILLLPLAAFFVDAGFTLFVRIWRKQRWWAPHVTHAYQAWARRVGHIKVTLAYAVFTLAGVFLMLSDLSLHAWNAIWACLAWYTVAFIVWARVRKDVPMGKEARE